MTPNSHDIPFSTDSLLLGARHVKNWDTAFYESLENAAIQFTIAAKYAETFDSLKSSTILDRPPSSQTP